AFGAVHNLQIPFFLGGHVAIAVTEEAAKCCHAALFGGFGFAVIATVAGVGSSLASEGALFFDKGFFPLDSFFEISRFFHGGLVLGAFLLRHAALFFKGAVVDFAGVSNSLTALVAKLV